MSFISLGIVLLVLPWVKGNVMWTLQRRGSWRSEVKYCFLQHLVSIWMLPTLSAELTVIIGRPCHKKEVTSKPEEKLWGATLLVINDRLPHESAPQPYVTFRVCARVCICEVLTAINYWQKTFFMSSWNSTGALETAHLAPFWFVFLPVYLSGKILCVEL